MLKLELCDHTDAVTGLSFSPRGLALLVSSSLDGTLKLWDMGDDGNMIKTLKTNSSLLFDCCWSPDGVTVASVGNYHSVSFVL
jgi:WD40 repeat protein